VDVYPRYNHKSRSKRYTRIGAGRIQFHDFQFYKAPGGEPTTSHFIQNEKRPDGKEGAPNTKVAGQRGGLDAALEDLLAECIKSFDWWYYFG